MLLHLHQLRTASLFAYNSISGYIVETVDYKRVHFTVWDVGGGDNVRPDWSSHYRGTKGIIFVVDSSDVDQFAEAGHQLRLLLRNDKLGDAAILVLANKQDLPVRCLGSFDQVVLTARRSML